MSKTVRLVKSLKSWNTMPIFRRRKGIWEPLRVERSTPSTEMEPAVGRSAQ